MDTGLPETSVQVEHCTRAPPQGKRIPPAIFTDFCIYLYVGFRPGSKGPFSVNLCTKTFADGQTHTDILLELGDMWPCGLAQPSSQQLATQPYLGGNSAQCLQVSSTALVQEGDRQRKAEVFGRPQVLSPLAASWPFQDSSPR